MTSTNHYVDNEKFHTALVEYVTQYREAKSNGSKLPKMSNYIGECIIKVGENFSRIHKYSKYPFLEEMIGDGILVCVSYIHNYDFTKYKNPHAYCTFVIERAFWRRIKNEKLRFNAKLKLMRDVDLTAYDTQEFDKDEDFKHVMREILQANTIPLEEEKPAKKRKDRKKKDTFATLTDIDNQEEKTDEELNILIEDVDAFMENQVQ